MSQTLLRLVEGYTARDGVTQDRAMKVLIVLSCVSLIASTFGSLPVHVYRRDDDGADERLVRHPLSWVLRRPNPWQTGMGLRQQAKALELLHGNAYIHLTWQRVDTPRYRGYMATQARVLDNARMEVEPDTDGAPVYHYTTRRGKRVEVPLAEMWHIKGLSTDGLTGRSVLTDARESIEVALQTQRYARSFFENDATPGFGLKTTAALSDKAYDRLKAYWDERKKGVEHAHTTAIFEEGLEPVSPALSQKDSQFLETRDWQRRELAGLFRVPPHMVGDVDRSTSWGSGIEQQAIGFLTFTMNTHLVGFEQSGDVALFPLTDRQRAQFEEPEHYLKVNVEGLRRGDIRTRFASYALGRMWGLYNANECRKLENLPPYEGGDVYIQAANMQDVRDLLTETKGLLEEFQHAHADGRPLRPEGA
jgi:HK97 family phage portal protein